MSCLSERVARRREIFANYQSELDNEGIHFMPECEGAYGTRWLTTATFDPHILPVNREMIRLSLQDHQIETRPLWKPMHMQPLYADCAYHGKGFDEMLFDNGLCLPSGSDLSEDEQSEVIDRIKKLIKS